MALLDDAETLIVAAALTGGVTGWLLNKGFMGDVQDKVVTIVEGVSRPSDHTPGTSHDYPAIQILVRSSKFDYVGAKVKMDAVVSALNDATVSGQVYMLLRQYPIPIGYDALQRPMISANFDIMRERL